jgi:hypothetical protein
MGKMRNAYRILVVKAEGKPRERPRRRWEDNIRMDLRQIWWESVDWIHLSQDRDYGRAVVDMVMTFGVA